MTCTYNYLFPGHYNRRYSSNTERAIITTMLLQLSCINCSLLVDVHKRSERNVLSVSVCRNVVMSAVGVSGTDFKLNK